MQLRYPVAKAGQVISNISDTDHFEAQGLFQYLGIKILFGIMSLLLLNDQIIIACPSPFPSNSTGHQLSERS